MAKVSSIALRDQDDPLPVGLDGTSNTLMVGEHPPDQHLRAEPTTWSEYITPYIEIWLLVRGWFDEVAVLVTWW